MKLFITARSKNADTASIKSLSNVIKAAGMTSASYRDTVSTDADQKARWAGIYDEISASDALIIDISDHPSDGRLVEAGIAYALKKPIIVIKKLNVDYKEFFDGISATVIEYSSDKDLAEKLKKFEHDRNFSVTDRSAMFGLFLLFGFVIAWVLSQYFIPLGIIAAIAYWFLVRQLFPPLRDFDRVVIFVPLVGVWLTGLFLLEPFYPAFLISWGIGFWIVALFILRKLKLAL